MAELRTVEAPSDGSDCPICLDGGDGGEEEKTPDDASSTWVETPCAHRFHGRCLETWTQVKLRTTCPMCRRTLTTAAAAAAASTPPEMVDLDDSVFDYDDHEMELARQRRARVRLRPRFMEGRAHAGELVASVHGVRDDRLRVGRTRPRVAQPHVPHPRRAGPLRGGRRRVTDAKNKQDMGEDMGACETSDLSHAPMRHGSMDF
uniref:RING-type domain-containing protein n=1 Tax=Oryza brachyantha TaxID=4533 RepID=J3MB77_ORYBR